MDRFDAEDIDTEGRLEREREFDKTDYKMWVNCDSCRMMFLPDDTTEPESPLCANCHSDRIESARKQYMDEASAEMQELRDREAQKDIETNDPRYIEYWEKREQ